MGDTTIQIANRLAALAPGTWPRTESFVKLDTSTVPATFDTSDVLTVPDNIARGVGLENNLIAAMIGVDLRESVGGRTIRVSIADFDGTREYTLGLDGTSVTTVSQPYADEGEALQAIKTLVDADGTLGPLVEVTVIDADGDGNLDTLVCIGKAEADYAVSALSASAGTNVLDLVGDSTSLEFNLFVVRGGVDTVQNPRPNSWRYVPLTGGVVAVTIRGYEERYEIAGERRIAMLISNVAAPADVAAGATVNSVTHTYRADVGYGIEPGST